MTIGLLKDTEATSEHKGQVFVNAFGEGGMATSPDNSDRELISDRESFSQWFLVHRPPANATYGDTEVVITRLGPDDVIVCETKNRGVESAIRDEVGADPAEGDVAMGTGDGTNFVCIHFDPSGDINITASGNVNIGGAAADSFVARCTELETLVTQQKTDFDGHGHYYINGAGAPTSTSSPTTGGLVGPPLQPPGVPETFPAWDANIASDTLKSD
jgi:hypothetical protein